MPTEKQITERNCVGLAIHYVNHKVQQKDMHWTGTLKVQGPGVDKENLIV